MAVRVCMSCAGKFNVDVLKLDRARCPHCGDRVDTTGGPQTAGEAVEWAEAGRYLTVGQRVAAIDHSVLLICAALGERPPEQDAPGGVERYQQAYCTFYDQPHSDGTADARVDAIQDAADALSKRQWDVVFAWLLDKPGDYYSDDAAS